MAHITLFDGARETKSGEALISAFAEIAKYQRIFVMPRPGSIDLQGFRIVKEAERVCEGRWNGNHYQVNTASLLENVLNSSTINVLGGKTFVLTELDLYSEGTNWCYGQVIGDSARGSHLVMSTYRLQFSKSLAHVATHELGHVFGAAARGRINTEDNLGSHCTNICVMQQTLKEYEMARFARQLQTKPDKFCTDCQAELRAYREP